MSKLTQKQNDALVLFTKYKSGRLRGHRATNGAACFRLLDEKLNPIANLDYDAVKQLQESNILRIHDESYTLNLTRLRPVYGGKGFEFKPRA